MSRQPAYFDYNDLRVAVAKLSIVVQKKAIVPACEHILFECDGSVARLMSTDIKTMYQTEIPCDGIADFTLDGALIARVLSLSKDSRVVSIHAAEGMWDSEVRIGDSSYIIQGYEPSVHPRLKIVGELVEGEFRTSDLADAIRHTKAGRDKDDILGRHGHSFSSKDGVAGVYATNGFTCQSFSMECEMEAEFTMPPVFASSIERMKGEFATLSVSDRFASISCERDTVSCVLIDVKMPDYRAVIGSMAKGEMSCVVTVEADHLNPCLDRCLVFSESDYDSVEVVVSEDSIGLFSGTVDMGEAREVVANWSFDGEPTALSFNCKALSGMTSQITGLVRVSLLKMDNGFGAMIVESVNEPGVQHLCTAIKMENRVERKPKRAAKKEVDTRSKREQFQERMLTTKFEPGLC